VSVSLKQRLSSSAPRLKVSLDLRAAWLRDCLTVGAGALVLRLICGVRFANYDTLYALVWGGQLSRGETPSYGTAIAPTPHPLIEVLGVVLSFLGAHAIVEVTAALAYLALAGCGLVVYRLGREWFNQAVGLFAALILLTRAPVLSYGTRAYIDVPYLLLVLCATLLETRRRHSGQPVLILLALAGLLRPEAWFFSGLYWLYVNGFTPRWAYSSVRERSLHTRVLAGSKPPPRGEMLGTLLLACSAALFWVASDLLVTGNPLWSLTNTRHTAETLDRVTGIGNVPEYIPRRIGEILRPPVLFGAAIGGVLSLLWLRQRARPGAIVGVVAVLVFAALASVGLPINSRYAFLAATILAIFCGAGAFGWMLLEAGDPRRLRWMLAGGAVLLAFVAFIPSQYREVRSQLQALGRQQRIQNELLALVNSGRISLRCGGVEVTNHAPIPLLALYLKTSPARIVSAQSGHITKGTYVEPADTEVQTDYILDPHDPPARDINPPPGFKASSTSRSWLIFESC
jgi:hypothetical protein